MAIECARGVIRVVFAPNAVKPIDLLPVRIDV